MSKLRVLAVQVFSRAVIEFCVSKPISDSLKYEKFFFVT